MKISIVTISYNQGRFLEQCIKSVLQQSYPDIEYIIVDPGSTDGSRQIIERYRDRVDKVIFEPDDGPADGLNKGFSIATGDIFGFLNADDFLLSSALKELKSAFVSKPKKDVISGNAIIVNSEGRILRRFYARRYSALRAVYGAATLPQQATFFRSDCFKMVGGFNPNNHLAWDGELWIDMALSGARFGRIDEFLAAFRLHGDNITLLDHASLAFHQYRNATFRRVRGRDKVGIDVAIRFALKGLEYMENPKILIDRLLRGALLRTGKD